MPLSHLGHVVSAPTTLEKWENTEFDAVLDASKGDIWPEETTLGPSVTEYSPQQQSRRTQRRHIAGAMRLFALNADATAKDREAVAIALRLPFSLFHEGFKKIREGPSLKTRGIAGAAILSQLPVQQHTVFALMQLGRNRGFWGPWKNG